MSKNTSSPKPAKTKRKATTPDVKYKKDVNETEIIELLS